MLSVFLVVLLAGTPALATYGVDVSTPVSESAFRCLKGNGFDFAVSRCWHSSGTVDHNVVDTVASAWAAGLAHVDVYMFPCPTCGNAKGQVADAVKYLRDNDVRFGMYWFDIEGPQYWHKDQAENRAFMAEMLEEARAQGVKIGIYSSESQWIPIFGDWSGGAAYPLWYANYDNQVSFADFRPFAGWSHPAIKQYHGTTYICGAGIDKDWYP